VDRLQISRLALVPVSGLEEEMVMGSALIKLLKQVSRE
jgi:hypothetical protein